MSIAEPGECHRRPDCGMSVLAAVLVGKNGGESGKSQSHPWTAVRKAADKALRQV